ncbi:MAG: succinyl-diaminopimelate desuccinylase [Candidatus Eutrophobiaceae bacterium]
MPSFSPIKLLEDLIRCRSVSPEDAGCQQIIAERLVHFGFEVTELPFGDVCNLYLRRGEAAPLFMFAGHTDVVPPGDMQLWDGDPFTPRHVQGLLYGRGAADMKSGLAAMATAMARFFEENPDPRGSVALLMTSDEEGRAEDGTRRAMEALVEGGVKPDWCLLGEPSSIEQVGDQMRIGRRGSLSGTLRVRGIQGHVAYPEKADNPVHRASGFLQVLCAHQWDAGNEDYPPTTLQVVDLHAGDGTDNVIPGELRLRFNFRFGTASTAAGLQAEIAEMLEEAGLDYDLEWRLSGEPFRSPPGALRTACLQAIDEICGCKPILSTGGGTSDGRFIAPYGIETLELGVVNASIHKINEHVRVVDVETLADIYQRVLEKLLA